MNSLIRNNCVRFQREGKCLFVSISPVTNLQYSNFLNECAFDGETCREYIYVQNTNCRVRWDNKEERFSPVRGYENHPVTHVTYLGARAHCQFIGGRLPTVEEWEYVATNGYATIYPWGNQDPSPDVANFGEYVGSTTAIGSYAPSESGLLDLCGNVWEWTSSAEHVGSIEGIANDKTSRFFIKGGAWSYSSHNLGVYGRCSIWSMSTGNAIGFRVVFDSYSEKLFDTGLIVGRFCVLHQGHIRLIEKAFNECDFVNVAIAKADQKYSDERTFLTATERRDILKEYFCGKSMQIEEISDKPDPTEWTNHVLSSFKRRPQVVYGGSWMDLRDFQLYSDLTCRVVQRASLESGGVSGTELRKRISDGREVHPFVVNKLGDFYEDLYDKRKILFRDVDCSDTSPDQFFDSVLEAINGLRGVFNTYSLSLRLPNRTQARTELLLTTNDVSGIRECYEAFHGFVSASERPSPTGGSHLQYRLITYFTPVIPGLLPVNSDFRDVKLHNQKRATQWYTGTKVKVIQTIDRRRLYIWCEEQKTLVAFLHSHDSALKKDAMHLARGLLLEPLRESCARLHAGAISLGDQAIVIFGPKGSGKTTTILRLLTLQPDWSFVSNDKLFLDSEQKWVFGSPQALRVGIRTLMGSKELEPIWLGGGEFSDDGSDEPKVLVSLIDLQQKLHAEIRPYSLAGIALIVDWSKDSYDFRRAQQQDIDAVVRDSTLFEDSVNPNWLSPESEYPSFKETNLFDWYKVEGSITNQQHFRELNRQLLQLVKEKGC